MFHRFTEHAYKACMFARKEAERLNHDHISPEHILLGLIKERSGVAAETMLKLNLDLDRAQAEMQASMKPRTDIPAVGQLPFTPAAMNLLRLAAEEARSMQHEHIGTEHLLLGLLRLKDCRATEILAMQQLKADEVRAHIVETLAIMPKRPMAIMEPMDPQYRDGPPKRDDPPPAAPSSRPSIFDRFTDRARKIMSFARKEAVRFNHDYIGTEHILLGLIIEGSGVAANVLESLDVDLEKLRQEVERRLKPLPPADLEQKQLPFTPRGKKVLEYAIEEARGLGHNYVGSEHVMLGLFRENEGIAAQVLMSPIVREKAEALTVEMVRNELRSFLGQK